MTERTGASSKSTRGSGNRRLHSKKRRKKSTGSSPSRRSRRISRPGSRRSAATPTSAFITEPDKTEPNPRSRRHFPVQILRVLSIDPALRNTGYAVIEQTIPGKGKRPVYRTLEFGTVKNRRDLRQ